jgi:hypothetical protein
MKLIQKLLMLVLVVSFAGANLMAQTAPTLVNPTDANTCLDLSTTFEWTAEVGAESYTLQITSDGTFNPPNVLNISGLTSNTYTFTLSELSTDHHWRVAAHYPNGSVIYSAPFTFKTVADSPDLGTPLDNTNWHPLLTTFTWYQNSFTNFHLQVASDETFTNMIFENNNILTLSQDVTLPNFATNYFWRVRGNVSGCWSVWSETRSFTTLVDKPVLTGPASTSILHAIGKQLHLECCTRRTRVCFRNI